MSSKMWPFKPTANKPKNLSVCTTAVITPPASPSSTNNSVTKSPATPSTPFSSSDSTASSPKEKFPHLDPKSTTYTTRKPATPPPHTPTNRLFPALTPNATLPQNFILTQHSNAFNSARATGMNKLQQLQYVQLLKQVIIDDAKLTCASLLAKSATLHVTTVRKEGRRAVFPGGFSDGVVFVARLVAVGLSGVGGEAAAAAAAEVVVMEEGEEEESLADAVESLWGKRMTRAGLENPVVS